MIDPSERVAIVGIGGVFPGAADPAAFWANVEAGVDSTTEVPPGRWSVDPAAVLDATPGAADRVAATRGGFVQGFRFDPEGLDLDPALAGRLDPSFQLALHAGRQAWRDARTAGLDRRRVGVILGNIVLPTEATSALCRETLGRAFEAAVLGAGGVAGAGDGRGEGGTEPLNRFAAGLPAGLLARALGLGGGSYTLDAACASSLYALKLAADEVLSGRADAMLTGGLSRPDPLYTQMGFSQLRALAPGGRAHPLDGRAAGLVVGEGAGVFVLKRLGDALRQGDHVYGLVAAVGLSNDIDGGLLAPSAEGQLRALRSAYAQAGWGPADVDLIECHATGTPVGDAVEIASLRALRAEVPGGAGGCVIGSHKGNIGHSLTASGSAGLLKVLLALRHGTLPPTANFAEPAAATGLAGSPFRVLRRSEPWPRRADGRPRRAAVSGFGFGGINAHALIEEWVPGATRDGVAPAAWVDPEREAEPAAVAVVGLSAHYGPWRGLDAFAVRALGLDGGEGDGLEPGLPANDWGVAAAGRAPGYHIAALGLRLDRFRIPPKELAAMLPQQSLLLTAAADAIADAGWDDRPRPRAGVVVGLGLDPNTTNFHGRWEVAGKARGWARALGREPSASELSAWSADLREAAGPALTADRTMGALGGLTASRVAREFRAGGPSFTVSSEETSGLRALEVAVRLLRRGDLDEAVVGAVDFTGDPRTAAAAARAGVTGLRRGDGAAALVLKRLDDAARDGDRVYAVVRGVGAASGGPVDSADPGLEAGALAARRALDEAGFGPAAVGYLEAPGGERAEASGAVGWAGFGPGPGCATGSASGDVGHAGAASGLAAVVKAALALSLEILPPAGTGVGARYWLHDRADGPRRAGVGGSGSDGSRLFVALEADDGPRAAARVARGPVPNSSRRPALFAVEADDPAGLLAALDALEGLAAIDPGATADDLARRWFAARPNDPSRRLGVGLVAEGAGELRDLVRAARLRVGSADPARPKPRADGRVYHNPEPVGPGGRVALVFPGIGNHFAGMGRELSAWWPGVFRGLDAETTRLRSQLAPGAGWDLPAGEPLAFVDHRPPIMAQVVLGTAVADLLRRFGVRPDAVLGYSLGESAALFATRAWTERDAMHARLDASPLFRTELAGPCEAARRAWSLAPGEPADWVAGVVPYPAAAIRGALADIPRAYLLIVNTPGEAVVGGDRAAVGRLVEALGGQFFPLPVVSTVHCPVAREVEGQYRALHSMTTTPPAGLQYYSAGWGRPYEPDQGSAVEAVVAQAVATVDFPAVVRRAYDDGVRVFIEAGPGASCSRMVRSILSGRPHLARSACPAVENGATQFLDLLARLVADRVGVDLASLYGPDGAPAHSPAPADARPSRSVTVAVGGAPFHTPPPPGRPRSPRPTPRNGQEARPTVPSPHRHRFLAEAELEPEPEPEPLYQDVEAAVVSDPGVAEPRPALTAAAAAAPRHGRRTAGPDVTGGGAGESSSASRPSSAADLEAGAGAGGGLEPLAERVRATGEARGLAHSAYLRAAGGLAATLAEHLRVQQSLVDALLSPMPSPTPASPPRGPEQGRVTAPPAPGRFASGPPRALDRAGCLEFAVGSIAAALGPQFAGADAFPTRVRLPDEPLMLVDRITAIEGEPRSMGGGRVVTEHDVLPGAWYLDAGRIPTGIAVESGQADLFLAGWLGVDFETRGLAVYRLLDAVVTFHRGLPGPGAVIRYEIAITEFFRQGDTRLFRFGFEGTVDGEPLLSMRDGCAGFFGPDQLAAGKGVVRRPLDLRPLAGKTVGGFTPLAPMAAVEQYDDRQVEALRRGDYASAFGPAFAGLGLLDPLRLPGGRLTLLHRVTHLDPTGGRFGLGLVRSELDIASDDWFLACHFIDDQVMPGTLMFECCLHTLRVFLLRAGWVAEAGGVAFEPVPGVSSRLKCRGQVTGSTGKAVFEVAVKEIGYGPEPYAVADALMYADGKAVVEVTDMTLRLGGLTREAVEAVWANRVARVEPAPAVVNTSGQIQAFATGNPSEAFGPEYRPFDEGRFLARLPGPPYSFLDRVLSVDQPRLVMAPGGWTTAEYDVPADAWYFEAARRPVMPFPVLQEIPLQVCGWLAAYMGSALTDPEAMAFRNLGGSGTLLAEVTPAAGALRTRVRATRVSRSAGMIIQNYDFETSAGGTPVYRGETHFGFFRREALADQVGIRGAATYQPSAAELAAARSFDFPHAAPYPDDRLRMIDRVEALVPRGGPEGLGGIVGTAAVDPSAWFFRAHFQGDPVWPGSLGLESFLQLLSVVAADRWGVDPSAGAGAVALGTTHRWLYRGQIVPGDRRVTVRAVVAAADDRRRTLTADGHLEVDGRVIYAMNGWTLALGGAGR